MPSASRTDHSHPRSANTPQTLPLIHIPDEHFTCDMTFCDPELNIHESPFLPSISHFTPVLSQSLYNNHITHTHDCSMTMSCFNMCVDPVLLPQDSCMSYSKLYRLNPLNLRTERIRTWPSICHPDIPSQTHNVYHSIRDTGLPNVLSAKVPLQSGLILCQQAITTIIGLSSYYNLVFLYNTRALRPPPCSLTTMPLQNHTHTTFGHISIKSCLRAHCSARFHPTRFLPHTALIL